jgi:hypothetical protein
VDRKCTRHHWCAIRKLCKGGEIDPSTLDLNSLFLALVSVGGIGAFALSLLFGLRAISNKVSRTPTIETSVGVTLAGWLLYIRPWTIWLWSRGSCHTLLLRGPDNPTFWLRGILKSFRCCILH